MLDVIHVFVEEDMIPTWEHGAEIKTAARSSIYRELYDTTYKYGTSSDQSSSGSERNLYSEPMQGEIKPYIPPTDPENLTAILGGPMGE